MRGVLKGIDAPAFGMKARANVSLINHAISLLPRNKFAVLESAEIDLDAEIIQEFRRMRLFGSVILRKFAVFRL